MCLPTPALNQALLTWRARQTPRGLAESGQLTPNNLCWTSTGNRGTWAENSSSLPATSTSCPRPETGQKVTQGWTSHRDRHGLSAPAVLCQPALYWKGETCTGAPRSHLWGTAAGSPTRLGSPHCGCWVAGAGQRRAARLLAGSLLHVPLRENKCHKSPQ